MDFIDFSAIGIESNFGNLDWCIVIVYLLVIVAIGVYIKRTSAMLQISWLRGGA